MKPKSLIIFAGRSLKSAICQSVVFLALCAFQPVWAQTAVINPQTLNYWAGVNTSNVLGAGSNSVTMTGADGVTTINLTATGQPSGLTIVLSTNSCTNSVQLGVSLRVTNVLAGEYPLTLNASGSPGYSTNVNFFVVPQWIQTNGATSGNWSDGTKWSSGSEPNRLGSDVYIEHMTPSFFTNVVDNSRTNQSLIYIGDADDQNPTIGGVTTVINPGVTLSVVGTNGFFIGRKTIGSARPWYIFAGDTMVVSNAAANFAIVDGNANATRYLTVNMTNLNNLNVNVSRFSVGDASLSSFAGAYNGAQMVGLFLARTNVIKASFVDDYNAVDFNTAIQFQRQAVANNGAQPCYFNLGLTNAIYADSVGVGRGMSTGSYPIKFPNVFSNSIAPFASAYFRNTSGGRMSLLAIAVDSGTSTAIADNNGTVDFRGGVVDMLVDQIWVAQNRTNSSSPRKLAGALSFDWGTINANTVILGNMKYTNTTTPIIGTLLVSTNGILNVNNNLILGQTPTNVTGFEAYAAGVSGQVTINNGGTIRANQITVGQFSTNNTITINSGGTLDVSNTVASSATSLTKLTVNSGGALTLHITNSGTLVYVTNLVASSGVINIASIAGTATFAPVISYAPGFGESASFVAGSVPAGYNAAIFNNTSTHTIDVTLSVGTPKTLSWQGYDNNQWDNTSKNWLDVNTGVHTNFATGDSVIFNDTGPASINVTEDVVPRQSIGIDGMTMTNNTLDYTFSGAGGIRGAASFVKAGSKSVTINNYSEISAKAVQGAMTCDVSGTIGSGTVFSGASLSLSGGSANVLGSVVNAGSLTNAGTIAGSLTVQTGGSVINSGTINGALSMQTGTAVYNLGTLNAIGAATVTTNSTLVNAGIIYGTSLTVATGGNLTDIVPGSSGVSAGSINVGTLAISGIFNPGGSSIATTKVTDYGNDGNQTGAPNGRVQLNAGSITTFQFNSTNSQPYTKLLSQSQVFGPSQNFKAINGCTLVITNVGPTPFTAGQSFKLFGQYYGDGNIAGAGLNSTNTYPIIQPSIPGPGLAWDMSQLYFSGTIAVVTSASLQVTLTNESMTVSPSNIIVHLSWPADKVGGWVQQLNTTLTNGLSATNWITPNGGYLTNLTSFTDVYLTNNLIADPSAPGSAVFFRFVYP